MNSNQSALAFSFSAAHGATAHAFKPGSTTWHKGERCIVIDTNSEDFVEPMTRVLFADGREGIFKASELGLKAADVQAYLASVRK